MDTLEFHKTVRDRANKYKLEQDGSGAIPFTVQDIEMILRAYYWVRYVPVSEREEEDEEEGGKDER